MDHDAAAATYANLLNEIKYRVAAIDDCLGGRVQMRARIAEEHCYLQLRMICELIAIGSLILHGDIEVGSKVRKSYQADRIIKALSEQHLDAYPQPIQLTDTDDDPPQHIPIKTGFLTKENFFYLYNQVCGAALHRGKAENILVKERKTDFDPIKKWLDRIIALLNRHTVISRDEETYFIFVMENGKAEVAWNVMKLVKDTE
ncbi:MAG: hypothetical protein ABUS57_07480 [Pseudomonadota bacterium]